MVEFKGRPTIPRGPAVWICGDCHTGNLGPLADKKGRTVVQIRDLDQTVIGNPAHDLIRLALSMASAARGSNLPGITTAKMVEHMIDGYENAFARTRPDESRLLKPALVKSALKRAWHRDWKDLAKERLTDTKPNIPLGSHFWPISNIERLQIEELFNSEKVRKLVTSFRGRDDDAAIEILDAAFWVKGCSSLGRLRYAVLLAVDGDAHDLCLVDVKEAVKALAPRYPRVRMPRDNAERVVAGASQLSPALGERMLAGRLQDRSVFLRELLPQDLKFEIERLSTKNAIRAARFLATIVGKAHARQMDASTRAAWKKELSKGQTKTLDAPSWLWTSVVDLLTSHEAGYLEHCRNCSHES